MNETKYEAVFWDIGGVIVDLDSVRVGHRAFVGMLADEHDRQMDRPVRKILLRREGSRIVSLKRPRERADEDTAAVDEDAVVCAYCGRPFVRETQLALHRGLEHGRELDDTEREAFEAAHAAESEELRLFRLKVVFVLVVIYFVFVMAYLLVV